MNPSPLFSCLIRLAALGLLSSAAGAQTVWFVESGACPGPGTGSQTDPFCSLSQAMAGASTGDTLLVAPGAYGTLDFAGKEVEVRSLAGPAVTSLQGVLATNDEGPSAIVNGFTIHNCCSGFATNGVRVIGASPTIQNNIIENNISTKVGGGGAFVDGQANVLFLNNIIRRNSAIPSGGIGGGMLIRNSTATLIGNTIEDNMAWEDDGGAYGAGIYASNSTVTLTNNLVVRNIASDNSVNAGGGLYAANCTVILSGNTFSGNQVGDGIGSPTPGRGGAIYLSNCTTHMADTLLWGDGATEGSEIYVTGGVLDVSYSNIDGGARGIAGPGTVVLGQDVMDRDPGLNGYHLSARSPLIDAGRPLLAPGGTDGDLDPRILDGAANGVARVDIGWDEYNPTQLLVTGNGALGTELVFDTRGGFGHSYLLIASLDTDDSPLHDYGSVLISLTPARLIGAGVVPASDNFSIPLEPSLSGLVGYFQALAFARDIYVGSLSRRVEVRIH